MNWICNYQGVCVKKDENVEETMTPAEKQILYSDLVKFNGEQHQCLVCIEELSELIKELVKYERGNEDEKQYIRIAEEIADVEIMLEQIKTIYDVEADVYKWKEEKLKRTKSRLNALTNKL